MPVLVVVLLLLSGMFLMGGFITMSQATLGVGSVAVACYLAIVARLAQAAGHHAAIKELRAALRHAPIPPLPTDPPLVKHSDQPVGAYQIRCQSCGVVGDRGPSSCPACGTAY